MSDVTLAYLRAIGFDARRADGSVPKQLDDDPPRCKCGDALSVRVTHDAATGAITKQVMVCLGCENADRTRLARSVGK